MWREINDKLDHKLAITSWDLAPMKHHLYSCLMWWVHFFIISSVKYLWNLKKIQQLYDQSQMWMLLQWKIKSVC